VPLKGILRPKHVYKGLTRSGGGGGDDDDDDDYEGKLTVRISYLSTNVFRRTIHYARVWITVC
jgi:hypothetical protein